MRNRLVAITWCLASTAWASAVVRPVPAQQVPAVALAPDTSWVRRSALYEVYVRDFSPSGDFRGLIAGLDRIAAVGANVVWLMPIHPVGVLNRKGPLGSSYSVRDYRAINPAFGTEADFRALVQAIHARGMKVILDWVPDHTSWDNVWVTEHPDFYVHDAQGNLIVPRDPAGHPTDWTDVAQLDYQNPALDSAMIATMANWLTDFDLDGFRVDVAGFIPDEFWREATTALRTAVPRPILLLAEAGELKMHRLGFDLSYSWSSYGRFKDVWSGAAADSFVSWEASDLADMPAGGMRMRFTTNHDETAWTKPPVTLFGGAAGARAAFVALALLPGRPLIYDGQEVESPQQLGLFVRDSIVWNQPDAAAATAFYARVVRLARSDSAFLTGDFAAVETSAPHDVVAYRRGTSLVLVNTRSRPVRISVTGDRVAGSRDVLSNRVQSADTVALPAYGAVVLER
jgi:glycosidase